MTHPLTPREKAAEIVDPWAFEFEPWNDNWKSVVARRQVEAFEKADAILNALASGSDNHAAQAEVDEHAGQSLDWQIIAGSWKSRATEAERKLAEALKHLKAMSHVAPRDFEVEAAYAFLSKEAERG